MVWRVVIDNQLELLDVQPARSDGRSDDDRHHARLEVRDSGIAVDLVLTSVQGHTKVALAHELAEEVIGAFLPVDEDKRTTLRVLVVCLPENLQ